MKEKGCEEFGKFIRGGKTSKDVWFESNENKGKIVKNQQAALMEHLKEWDEMGDARERRDR